MYRPAAAQPASRTLPSDGRGLQLHCRPAGHGRRAVGQRTQGYWTGLRLGETEHQLYDTWRDLNPTSSRAFTHISTTGQSAARLDRWLVSETLSRGSAGSRERSGRFWVQETTWVSARASQLQPAHCMALQPGGCPFTSWTISRFAIALRQRFRSPLPRTRSGWSWLPAESGRC